MTENTSPPMQVPIETPTLVPTECLSPDHDNPRLVGVGELTSDIEIVTQLYRGEDLSELIQSIAVNGYLDIEPLIVELTDDRLIVLEGNRRLAILMLFLQDNLANDVFKASRVRIRLPEISQETRDTLQQVSVYRVANREAARSYIGFKHIIGAARWGSYAKAKFAAEWFRDGQATLDMIAESIGDKHDTIKRMVNAIYVLEQSEASGRFRLEDRSSPRFNFSHLYTALSRSTFMEFLGLDSSCTRYNPFPTSIPAEKLEELGEILRWIYGSKEQEIEPIIQSQNPDIKELGQVLISSEGLAVLRTTGSLKEAYASTRPAEQKLSEALIRARTAIREASNSLRGYDGQDRALVDIAEDVSETAQAVHARMLKKMKEYGGDA